VIEKTQLLIIGKEFDIRYRNSKILGIIFFVIAGIFLISFISLEVYLTSIPMIKNVPCYDRFSNVIQGLTCKEDENTSSAIAMTIPFGLIIGIFFLIGLNFYNKYEV
jgi:hypothetical protein